MRKKYSEPITPGVGPSGGLVCPSCGCRHFPVVYTRHLPDGRILRRRRCRLCGRRITTIEEIKNA